MSRINAGVIGLGFIGPQHMDAICRTPDARLYAVCDADEAAALKLDQMQEEFAARTRSYFG